MAEMLVRVVDKINDDDFFLNCRCTKRGDVIVVSPDDWPWGFEERVNPDWRLLAVPDLSMAFAATLLSPEFPLDATDQGRTLQRRAFRLDLESPLLRLNDGYDAWLADAGRRVPRLVLPGLLAALAVEAAKRRKPRIPDPGVIGRHERVIG